MGTAPPRRCSMQKCLRISWGGGRQTQHDAGNIGDQRRATGRGKRRRRTVYESAVLIVDDDVNAQIIAETLLRLRGLEVQVTTETADAVDRIARAGVGVVVVDLNMPGMNGFEGLRRLRAAAAALASATAHHCHHRSHARRRWIASPSASVRTPSCASRWNPGQFISHGRAADAGGDSRRPAVRGESLRNDRQQTARQQTTESPQFSGNLPRLARTERVRGSRSDVRSTCNSPPNP